MARKRDPLMEILGELDILAVRVATMRRSIAARIAAQRYQAGTREGRRRTLIDRHVDGLLALIPRRRRRR